MRNPEFGPKFELKKEEEISKGEPEREEKFRQETIEKLKEAVKKLGTTSSKKISLSEYRKYYERVIKPHRVKWGYKDWDDFLAKEGLRMSKKEETIQKLKEAVTELGPASAKIQRNKYRKYYRRFLKQRTEWGYRDWEDFLEKESLKSLKMLFKEETIQKLKEGVKKFGTSSRKINRSEYRNYYERFSTHKTEWGYKDWPDFLEKENLMPIREFEKRAKEIAKEAWNEFLEKYKHILGIEQVSTELFVEHFLEREYPQEKEKVKKKVMDLLNECRKKELEKILKNKII